MKQELTRAADRVSDAERNVLSAHSLLQRCTTELLDEDEWGTLCTQGGRLRAEIPRQLAQLRERLGQSVAGDALAAEVGSLSRELQQRLANAHRYLCADDVSRNDAVRLVESWLPVPARNLASMTTRVEVQSRVVPGTALGSCFAEGYPADDGIERYSAARYKHVPELAQTVLKNEKGQALFLGLRHGIIDAEELDSHLLAALTDQELQSLVDEFVLGEGSPEPPGQDRAQQVRERCDAIRTRPVRAAMDALTIREAAYRHMAKESAAAALVADHGRLRRALAGEAVNLRLFTVSLLTRDDYTSWCAQQHAFAELDQEGPIELQVRDPSADGVVRTVVADVQVRQFVLSARDEALNQWADQVGNDEVEWLLGPPRAPELGGAIKATLDTLNARIAKLSDRFITMDQEHARVVQERGAHDPESRELNVKILELQEKRAHVEKKALTLKEVGTQLKAMWVQEEGLPTGIEAHKKAAARLALVGRLMREMPVLICMSGRDFTRQLDPEMKFLATVADRLDGHLPPVEEQMETWGPARSAFRPQ